MVDSADLLIAYKEYPHTDVLERALELVDLCAAIVEKRIRPVAAMVDCEMIVTVHTSREPARSFVDRIQAMEGKDGVLSISHRARLPLGRRARDGHQGPGLRRRRRGQGAARWRAGSPTS